MSIYQGDQKVANNITIENTSYSVPIGTIISYASTTLPTGFLLCDGSEISKTDYADLYAAIGNKFGTATDTTKFKLPDLREAVPVGVGQNTTQTITNHDVYTLGQFKDDNVRTLVYADNNKDFPIIVKTNDTSHEKHSGMIVSTESAGNEPSFLVGTSSSGSTHSKQLGLHYIIKASKVSDQSSDIIDDTANTTNKTWSAKKISESIPTTLPANGGNADTVNEHTVEDNVPAGIFAMLPFQWELIGTSTPETGDTSTNTFSQTITGGNPFCVYHASGLFCFGNGIPANRGKLYGMTSGYVASVTYTEQGLLTVTVGQGKAYIYQMKQITT